MLALAIFLLVVLAITYPVARKGRPGTAIGIAGLIVFVVGGAFVWVLGGMSEYPDNSIGNPRRVHVRNDSDEMIYVTDGPAAEAVLDEVLPRELVIIRGAYHPEHSDRACTDRPTRIVQPAPGTAVLRTDQGLRGAAADLLVLAELAECYPRGRNVVLWDGSSAAIDPSARPPLIDPADRPLVFGLLLGAVSLIVGVVFDVVRRRRPDRSQSRPCSTA